MAKAHRDRKLLNMMNAENHPGLVTSRLCDRSLGKSSNMYENKSYTFCGPALCQVHYTHDFISVLTELVSSKTGTQIHIFRSVNFRDCVFKGMAPYNFIWNV